MQNIYELSSEEINSVSGSMSILDLLREAFPFGEFCNGSFHPNGCPSTSTPGPYTTSH